MSRPRIPSTEWQPYPSDAAARDWNATLEGLDGCNVFQSYEWGELKRGEGWLPVRLVRRNANGDAMAMAQTLTRRYAGKVAAGWIPGGPAGSVVDWADSLGRGLVATQALWSCYLRLNSTRVHQEADVALLNGAGWTRPRTMLGSRWSVRLGIHAERERNFAMLTGNWRHNLRRAQKANLVVEAWGNPNARDVAQLYAEMEGYKGLASQQDARELEGMFSALGDRLVVYRCVGGDGELLSVRACGVIGAHASDLLAATGVQGRKSYASYLVCWEMLDRCRQLGVREFDFSGVDPDANPGVFNFKKGTGAEMFSYLGEWETSSPRFLAPLANRLLRRRQPRAGAKVAPSTG